MGKEKYEFDGEEFFVVRYGKRYIDISSDGKEFNEDILDEEMLVVRGWMQIDRILWRIYDYLEKKGKKKEEIREIELLAGERSNDVFFSQRTYFRRRVWNLDVKEMKEIAKSIFEKAWERKLLTYDELQDVRREIDYMNVEGIVEFEEMIFDTGGRRYSNGSEIVWIGVEFHYFDGGKRAMYRIYPDEEV